MYGYFYGTSTLALSEQVGRACQDRPFDRPFDRQVVAPFGGDDDLMVTN